MPIATLGIDDAARNTGRILRVVGEAVTLAAKLVASPKAVKAIAKFATRVAAAQAPSAAIEAGVRSGLITDKAFVEQLATAAGFLARKRETPVVANARKPTKPTVSAVSPDPSPARRGVGEGKRPGGPYSHFEDHPSVGPSKDFTSAQKRKFYAQKEARNGGVRRDDRSKEVLDPGKQHARAVRPPDNESQIDHIMPKSKGGSNSSASAEVRSRAGNIAKSDKMPELPTDSTPQPPSGEPK